MSRNRAVLLAGLGSLGLLIGALLFQYVGDMAPCKMCYWQRYPHVGAIIIAGIILITGIGVFAVLGLLSALITAGIGGFHAGVERGWWEGPQSCTSTSIDNLSTEELLAQIMSAPMVRCDEIPWQMFGLSMAGWNMVVSICLAVLWTIAIKQQRA
ncbi:MAG: disulfide bond formation protein B [Paracoccaceae bacterium]|jgi:disulfide bond formation protein DsbB|nr:disulfide bond formation protein B [Paracoccaceae bacterium]NDH26702.1 disulfide bond formation protein B [Paracoccaceae bacterium]|tara:strand:- start:10635 stop:11099 length:465 start_codon:yes stop_codon:yes gene_type:complete